MDALATQAIVKPTRTPDYITSYGSAYWWVEMVRLSADHQVGNMEFDNDTQTLWLMNSYYRNGKTSLSREIAEQYLSCGLTRALRSIF